MYDINFYMKAYAFIKRIKKDGISKEAAALNFENLVVIIYLYWMHCIKLINYSIY